MTARPRARLDATPATGGIRQSTAINGFQIETLDQADTGELKLMGRSFRELRHAFKVFRPFKGRRIRHPYGVRRLGWDCIWADYAGGGADGRMLIRESWRWTCGDVYACESEIEEVPS